MSTQEEKQPPCCGGGGKDPFDRLSQVADAITTFIALGTVAAHFLVPLSLVTVVALQVALLVGFVVLGANALL